MIGRLSGTLVWAEAETVLIDVGGVGYEVGVSARTRAALPAIGSAVTLAVETRVREDAIALYGFLDAGERSAFRALLGVQGVGAKVALALLSVLSPAEIARAVAAQDVKALMRAAGVGQRLAARLVTELAGKPGVLAAASSDAQVSDIPAVFAPADPTLADALSALASLGYRRGEVEPALAAARARLGTEAPVEALIRDALRTLAPR